MHDLVLGTAGVPEMRAGLMTVGWAAWNSNEAERHEDRKGDAHRAERSEAEESQAFGRKEEGFMEEVELEVGFEGWVKCQCVETGSEQFRQLGRVW